MAKTLAIAVVAVVVAVAAPAVLVLMVVVGVVFFFFFFFVIHLLAFVVLGVVLKKVSSYSGCKGFCCIDKK